MTSPGAGVARLLATAVLVLALQPPAPARAQSQQGPDEAIVFEDLGFTDPRPAGARGTAFPALAASAADAAALVYNPASLGRIKRISALADVANDRSRLSLDYGRGPWGNDSETTRLGFAGAAWPVPVVRGSLVPAVAVHRMYSSDRQLNYSRVNVPDNRAENYEMDQTGSAYAYTLGVGFDLSAAFTTGFSAFLLHGNTRSFEQFDWTSATDPGGTHRYVLQDTHSHLTGFGFRAGMEMYALRHVQIGVCLTSPIVVDARSDRRVETTVSVPDSIGSFDRSTETFTTRYRIPYRVDGAIAVPFHPLLVAVQVGYTNWSRAMVDRHRIATMGTDTVLRPVLEVSGGIEWSVGSWPLRLLAGVSQSPTPLKYLETDRVDHVGLEPILDQSGRTRVSAGFALLMRSSWVLEASFSRTTGRRRSVSLADDYHATYTVLQGSYWF